MDFREADYINRSFSLSRNKINKSKTIQWIKSRNCDLIGIIKVATLRRLKVTAFKTH